VSNGENGGGLQYELIQDLSMPQTEPHDTAAPPASLSERIVHHLPGSFASLGPAFYTRLPATPVPAPYLVGFSPQTAQLLGIEAPPDETPRAREATGGYGREFVDYFAGNRSRALPHDALPLASVYSGHQFGAWAGQLGDGRALLLGELDAPALAGAAQASGANAAPRQRYEIQLKGAGLTPYSRMGDGRAVLRSSIREFLASEAMHALGIPTTRALCIVGSDLPVRRESVETAAVVTRVAETFVRFGHFEHFYSTDRPELLKQLADHVIERSYPECRHAADPYAALLAAAGTRTADLLAQWQSVGFCHGVMNTDNMSIAGLTIDYGPYGFLDGFDAGHICNHSDDGGRYAYARQPQVAYWNMFCLAQALLPLIGPPGRPDELAIEAAQSALEPFKARYGAQLAQRLQAKLGLQQVLPHDTELTDRLFALMQANRADFTLSFRNLARVSRHDTRGDGAMRDLFIDRGACDAWLADYRARLGQEARDDAARAAAMDQVNPKYILRNHLAEQAIRLAQQGDFSELERVRQVLSRPFDEQTHAQAAYGGLPPDWAGTLEVSCSS
jgi:uncharacterized protein YdiU (UPF0061 family)